MNHYHVHDTDFLAARHSDIVVVDEHQRMVQITDDCNVTTNEDKNIEGLINQDTQ